MSFFAGGKVIVVFVHYCKWSERVGIIVSTTRLPQIFLLYLSDFLFCPVSNSSPLHDLDLGKNVRLENPGNLCIDF